MEHLYNMAYENVIKDAYDESQNKQGFCPTQCPYKKYCKNHKKFQELCKIPTKRLDKLK